MKDFFNARDLLKVGEKEYVIYRLDALEKAGLTNLKLLPFSIRVVLEAALRQCNDKEITQTDVKNIAAWTSLTSNPSPKMGEGDSAKNFFKSDKKPTASVLSPMSFVPRI